MNEHQILQELRLIKKALRIPDETFGYVSLFPTSFWNTEIKPLIDDISEIIVASSEKMEKSHQTWKTEILNTLNAPLSKLEGMVLFFWWIWWNIFVWGIMGDWNSIWPISWALLIAICLWIWLYLRHHSLLPKSSTSASPPNSPCYLDKDK